jgi:hypothetical protein
MDNLSKQEIFDAGLADWRKLAQADDSEAPSFTCWLTRTATRSACAPASSENDYVRPGSP